MATTDHLRPGHQVTSIDLPSKGPLTSSLSCAGDSGSRGDLKLIDCYETACVYNVKVSQIKDLSLFCFAFNVAPKSVFHLSLNSKSHSLWAIYFFIFTSKMKSLKRQFFENLEAMKPYKKSYVDLTLKRNRSVRFPWMFLFIFIFFGGGKAYEWGYLCIMQ